ncbi:MAG: DivIVA domain-containing protein [Ilumatobacteraceae bacterium]
MAMSFARPDPSSPASVAEAAFGTSRRGFDQNEVKDFLRMVAAELGRLQERERFLERELRTAQTNPDLDNVRFDDATLTRLLGEETARVLSTAREAATEIREKAEQNAARLLSEASDEALRMREEAEVEASRRRSDAASDAEAELAMAKQQGREMVNEARAYRERVLSELARRRELAREQIEQLMHGRDRLMQAFERARVVAVDVVAELKPLGEPDEYVNLSPTTGPVPVMVPNSRRPDERLELVADPIADTADATEPVVLRSVEPPPTEEIALVEVDDAPSAVDDDLASDAASIEPDAAIETEAVIEEDAHDLDATAEHDTQEDTADVATILPGNEPNDESIVPDIEPAVQLEPAAHEGPVDDAPDERDDVVVDLFARLRAESEPAIAADVAAGHADELAAQDGEVDAARGDERSEADSPFRRRDAELTPLIVASAKKLKRVLADEQNDVLDRLRRNVPVRTLDELLPARDAHVDTFAVAIDTELRAAATAGAASVATGRAAKLNKSAMADAVDAARAALGEWLVNPLRERLDRCVADGSGDNDAIARSIRSIYREWKTQHIDDQLDDVLRTAHGRAVLSALPAGAPVCWGVDEEHPACADGDDNALAGCVAAGQPFPTGHLFAPSHVGCRCLLVPADQ